MAMPKYVWTGEKMCDHWRLKTRKAILIKIHYNYILNIIQCFIQTPVGTYKNINNGLSIFS